MRSKKDDFISEQLDDLVKYISLLKDYRQIQALFNSNEAQKDSQSRKESIDWLDKKARECLETLMEHNP